MSETELVNFTIRVEKKFLLEIDAYAESLSRSRADTVRELLVYALADKKADIYGSPIAEMVTRIMRSELMAFREAQDSLVLSDREILMDSVSELLGAGDSVLLFLTSLLQHPSSDLNHEDLFNMYKFAGRLSAAGYPYEEALTEGARAIDVIGESASDDLEAW